MTSKIKVDNINKVSDDSNIIKKCGSTTTVGSGAGNTIVVCGATVTIGRCGGSVALASGATQSGFGREGSVNWQTGAIKTTTFTAANGEGYFADTTSSGFTMNLPAGSAGNIVAVQDYKNTFGSNSLTITPNGSNKINGGSGNITLATDGEGVTLVYIDSTVGWRSVTQSEFSDVGAQHITATGGTITTVCTNFKVHTFTGPGTFCVSAGSGPLAIVDYMVVAGGGSGGRGGSGGDGGGGGGAGGFRESKSAPVSGCWTATPLATPASVPLTTGAYPITVGAGGSAAPSYGNPGSDSIAALPTSITSAGGGGGGSVSSGPGFNPPSYPGAGGSGGGGRGGGGIPALGAAGNTPPVSPPQGNSGGVGGSNTGPNPQSPDNGAGGGGGAGAVGGNTTAPSTGGAGGTGVTNTINGSPVIRSAGGGGSGQHQGGPVVPGSGAGNGGWDSTPGSAGAANQGGGGGGNICTPGAAASAGGSGIVIIRYKFQ